MEAAGLAIGVAGLLAVCLDVVEQVESYQNFGTQSRQLNARFTVCKLRLQDWAKSVGIVNGELEEQHHARLDIPEVAIVVKGILFSVCEIFGKLEDAQTKLRLPVPTENQLLYWPTLADKSKRSTATKALRPSMGSSMRWTVKGKTQFIDQVSALEALVSGLYDTVSPVKEDMQPVQRQIARVNTEKLIELIDTQRTLKLFMEEIRHRTLKQAYQELDEWLDVQRLDRQYERHLDDRLEGTCEWIFKHTAYLEWVTTTDAAHEAKFLWINGPAGYGKSILCARIYEHLSADSKWPCAYLSCTSHVQVRGQPDTLVRYWLSQVARTSEAAFDIMLETLRSGPPTRSASDHQIWSLLRGIVSKIDHCTFVVDGFDEYNSSEGQRKNVLRKIKSAVAGTKTHCLVVSRIQSDIELELDTTTSEQGKYRFYECRISQEDVNTDVQSYSDHVVSMQLPKLERGFRSQLAMQMAGRCEGMFLWIKLQQDRLQDWRSQKALQNIVQSMPKGLNSSYDRNWAHIQNLDSDDYQRATQILRWSTFAVRPLTIGELAAALLINLGPQGVEPHLDGLPDATNDGCLENEIKALCYPLIEVRSATPEAPSQYRTVHVMHPSVREYLISVLPVSSMQHVLSPEHNQEELQHVHLTHMCIQYLNLTTVWDCKEDETGYRQFIDYATFSWFEHAKRIGSLEESVASLLSDFLFHGNESFVCWAKAYERRFHNDSVMTAAAEMYYAALFGLNSVMKRLRLRVGDDINVLGGPLGTSLHAACYAGRTYIVGSLIDWGADINIAGHELRTPLLTAAFRNHTEVILLLLEKGAAVKTRTTAGETALHFACHHGNMNVVLRLLEAGAEVDALNETRCTPLMMAAEKNYLDIIQVLITRNADVNAADQYGVTPLARSSAHGYLGAVKLLIHSAADVNVAAQDGVTALHRASANGHLEATNLLLESGADANAVSRSGSRPIYTAAFNGDLEIVKLLIEAGADPKAAVAVLNGFTPILAAASNGHLETIKLLLDHGADVNVTDSQHTSVLSIAVLSKHMEVARYLLDYGVCLNVADSSGYAELHYAAKEGDTEIAQLLLDRGADLDMTSPLGYSSLHVAILKDQTEMFRFLLDRGANMDVIGPQYTKLLHLAACQGRTEIVQLLLQRGADVSASNCDGTSPLYFAAYQGHIDVMKLLLDSGADINVSDTEGWKLLHAATTGRQTEVVRFLLNRCANVDTADCDGVTALHQAAQKAHIEIARLLLAKGADVNRATLDGSMPLHFAAGRAGPSMISLLLDHGAMIEARNSSKDTPLHKAISKFHEDGIEALLGHGADLEAVDEWGLSCLDYLTLLSTRFGKFPKWKSDHKQTVSNHQISALLMKGVRNASIKTLQESLPRLQNSLQTLGMFLLHLGMFDDARLVFQCSIISSDETTPAHHTEVDCDFCDKQLLQGTRFICKVCLDTDKCEACAKVGFELKTNSEWCGHEFLDVPIPEPGQLPSEEQMREKLESWSKLGETGEQ